jgi:hypothetical protein
VSYTIVEEQDFALTTATSFFYIDKTTLSYAAIFGIEEDLDLHGAQYSWLRFVHDLEISLKTSTKSKFSSIFYFGFLAWALPTNLLLQRLPVGRYLGFSTASQSVLEFQR